MDGTRPRGQNRPVRRKLSWLLLVATSVGYLGMLIWWLTSKDPPPTSQQLVWVLIMVPSPLIAGAYLMWRCPSNRIGRLVTLSGISIFAIPTMLELPTVRAFETSGAQAWMWAPIWGSQTLNAVGAVLTIAVFVLIPDGSFRHLRDRRLVSWSWVTVALPTLALISNDLVRMHELSFPGVEGVVSPLVFDWLTPLGPALASISLIGYAVIVVAVLFLFLRYREAPDRERRQVRWVLYGGAVAMLIAGIPFILGEIGLIPPLEHNATATVTSLPIPFFYAFLAVAVIEPRWIDVDSVIRKSFVYGVLSFVILLVYVATAAAFGVVAAESRLDVEAVVVITVVVAILFQPARRRLQTVADRWVFGSRPTGYEAVTEFGETIEEAGDPSELLPGLAETVRKSIRVAWVSATLDDGSRAESGEVAGQPTLTVPIGVGRDKVGIIQCGPRLRGSLDDDERHLVQTLAMQVGLAVMNARLAGRIVNAAEAERRRIERNIHDGAQQELVALVARLGLARTNAGSGRLTAEEIDALQREARHILSDLRNLAQGIHPSVLTDGGILEAVEDRCTHLPIEVSLHASDSLRTMRFDDDVEGAAYFFVSEALANVLKHAGASHVDVSLARRDGSIHLEVSDNGRGFDPALTGHDGLAGLSDRLQALGGTMTVSCPVSGGTRVQAELPARER